MRDFGLLLLVGLLATMAACPDGDGPSIRPPNHGSPDEPDAQPGPNPSSEAPTPTTAIDSTTLVTGTTAGETTSSGGDTSSGAGETTSTSLSGQCGDGEQDPGEQCDDGYQFNSDDAACTASCALAVCGDGLVWQEKEQCDLGPDNNDTTYNGCTESCAFGPRCNDGVLQIEEECDPSAPPIEGEVTCEPDTCRFVARLAFVTTMEFKGDLDGLALADATCAGIAGEQGLDRASAFKAWLSNGVTTPQGRLENAVAVPMPYARRDGQILADNLEDLIAHGVHVPLNVTESGTVLPTDEPRFAWSDIGADGEPASIVNHCAEWGSSSLLKNGQVGKISPASADEFPMWQSQKRWTNDTTQPCSLLAHLYCFED